MQRASASVPSFAVVTSNPRAASARPRTWRKTSSSSMSSTRSVVSMFMGWIVQPWQWQTQTLPRAAARGSHRVEGAAEAFGCGIGQGEAEAEAIMLGRLETEPAGRCGRGAHAATVVAHLDFEDVAIGARGHLDARIAIGERGVGGIVEQVDDGVLQGRNNRDATRANFVVDGETGLRFRAQQTERIARCRTELGDTDPFGNAGQLVAADLDQFAQDVAATIRLADEQLEIRLQGRAGGVFTGQLGKQGADGRQRRIQLVCG